MKSKLNETGRRRPSWTSHRPAISESGHPGYRSGDAGGD